LAPFFKSFLATKHDPHHTSIFATIANATVCLCFYLIYFPLKLRQVIYPVLHFTRKA